ncbi:hypothetical protein EMCRGX_G004969 [Ephydatia muelleri]
MVAAVGSIRDSCSGRPMDPGRAYARRDCAGVRLRWTWRNGRLAANPKVVDLRVAGWSVCLAVPKNGEPEGGGVVPMLGGPAEVSCEPSRTEREKESFESRFEAAMVLVVPGVKRNATTVSLLNVLLDRVLTQPESIPASRISSSGNEMILDSAALLLMVGLALAGAALLLVVGLALAGAALLLVVGPALAGASVGGGSALLLVVGLALAGAALLLVVGLALAGAALLLVVGLALAGAEVVMKEDVCASSTSSPSESSKNSFPTSSAIYVTEY